MENTRLLLSVAKAAARDASELIMQVQNLDRQMSTKSSNADLVTNTDKQAEQTIKEDILTNFPDHGILAEESGVIVSDSAYQWVIDPLDGTTNFVHGLAPFCVSIALMKDNEPLLSVVSELPAGNLFWAVRDEGAYCNGEPIHVATTKTIADALLITGFAYDHDSKWETNMNLFKEFTHVSHGVRRLGSAAADLCYVACGKADGFWEIGLHPWDSAAGILLVKESGGKVSRMDGNVFSIHDQHLLATNGHLHQEMLEKTTPAIASISGSD